jgi:hypothetical protein
VVEGVIVAEFNDAASLLAGCMTGDEMLQYNAAEKIVIKTATITYWFAFIFMYSHLLICFFPSLFISKKNLISILFFLLHVFKVTF